MGLTAALIGLGNIAWRYDMGKADANGSCLTHLSTLTSRGDIEVVGGFDSDNAVRTDWTGQTGLTACDNIASLLALKPDIVSICSPNSEHAVHLEFCLNAEVPMIWLEKPATDSLVETDRLLALQRQKAASTILVGFQRRYLPVYRRLKHTLDELGPALGVSLVYSRGLETNGSHLIDLLFYLFGDEIKWQLSCQTSEPPMQYCQEPSPSFLIEIDGGPVCTVTGLDLPYHSIDVAIHFDDGRASVLYGGLQETWEKRIENPLFSGFCCLQYPEGGHSQKIDPSAEMRQVFPAMLNDLIAASRSETAPASSLVSARAGQALVKAVKMVNE